MATREPYARAFDEDVSTTTTDTCPECDGRVHTNSVETRCADCGLVLDGDPIDHGPEWRSFEEDEDEPSRTGAPLTQARHDRGLSTEIGWKRDANGTAVSDTKRRQLARLRTHHNRARFDSKRERNLAYACQEIARIVGALDLPRDVREEASRLFRAAQADDLVHGRSLETIAAGSVYGACRTSGVLRPIEEVAGVAKGDRGKVLLGYRVLNRELGLATPPLTAGDVLPRVSDAVDAPQVVEARAVEIALHAAEQEIGNGCSPSGMAAGCLYQASEERAGGLTQMALADAAGVTTMTVRRRWREIREEVV